MPATSRRADAFVGRSSGFYAVALLLCLLLTHPSSCEVRELIIDPLTSADYWQVGGHRINYTLGRSALAPSTEQVREGAERSLRLTYDFRDAQRSYVSAYHTGPAIRGECREVALWIYGDASGRRLRMQLEDARERWFERDVGQLDWTGWQELRAPIGDGAGWRALLRRGEGELPILHPVNLRQIAVLQKGDAEPEGVVYLSDLRATCDVQPADYIDAAIQTGRMGNLFDVGEEGKLSVELTNAGEAEVQGDVTATVTDFSGAETEEDLGATAIPARGQAKREVTLPTGRLGTYDVAVRLRAGERERVWFARYAVTRPLPERPADPQALFGCMFNVRGFSPEQMPTVWRLNRDAGIRWTRIGFSWGEINPAPGVWAWDGPHRIDGPVGKAVDLQGQSYRLTHTDALSCADAMTIAFWARGTERDGNWQFPVMKWGASQVRNYGCYFHRDTGDFTFSASYENEPLGTWHDTGCGFSAWDGQWHHYAASYSAADGRVSLYIDGKPDTAADVDGGRLRTNLEDLTIGSSCPAPLDELVVYRRALGPDEVAKLAAKQPPPQEGLIAHWAFEDTGPMLRDSSGNGLDLGGAEPTGVAEAREALAHGIKTLGLLGFPPKWASTAPEDAERAWVYKPDLDAWAAFVENTTRQYADLVQHWEIWNEPNITVFWEPTPDPREYFDVLRVGYEAAKRGNPDCTVIMPGLAGPTENRWGMDFLDEVLALGGPRFCDGIAIHPYRQSTPEASDLVGDLEHIAEGCRANGGGRLIWYTENCWTTQIPGGSTERRQALMLPLGYVLSLGTGLMQRLIWFRLHDPGVDRFYSEHNYGMCYNDLTPKPAYFAHRTVATLLEGAQPDGNWDVGDAMARVFRTPTERVAVVWCPEGRAAASIYVGRPEVRVVDMMGNEATRRTEDGVLILDATEETVFLRGLPDEAEGRGAVLGADEPQIVRGGQAMLTVLVQNPFDEERRAQVTVSAEEPVSIGRGGGADTVAAKGLKAFMFEVAGDEAAEPGHYPVEVQLSLGTRRFEQQALVAVRGAEPDAGPVGEWKLDEGEGAVIRDSSGHENHGTVAQPQWVEGVQGKALQFDGQGFAEIPDAPSLNLRDEVTVALWLKLLGETGTWQFPLTKQQPDPFRRNYVLYLHQEKLYPCFSASFEQGGYLHSDIASSVPINDGEWHHLAATYSMFERRVTIYIDGKPVVEREFNEGAMLLAEAPIRIGGGTVGIIDEVVVCPRVLDPLEVEALSRRR